MAKNLVTLNVENVDYSIRPYGTCSTVASTAAKTVAIDGFTLCAGATVLVKFTQINTAPNPTLNINSTGAKPIKAINGWSMVTDPNIYYEFLYDGTNWKLIGEEKRRCKLSSGNTNNYPWRRIAYTDILTTTYQRRCTVLILNQAIFSGKYGELVIKVSTNNTNAPASYEAYWLINKGFSAGSIKIGVNNTFGNTYFDVFYKCPSSWQNLLIEEKTGGFDSNFYTSFTLCNSVEPSDTTTTDKLTSIESYTSIEDAATELHNVAYTAIVEPNCTSGTSISEILFNGKSTNSDKFGGQLPAYFATASKQTELENQIKALAAGLTLNLTASPSTIYKNESKSITLTATVKDTAGNVNATSIVIKDGSTELKSASNTYTTNISKSITTNNNTYTFTTTAVVNGMTLNKSVSISARNAVYYGMGNSASAVKTNGSKASARTSAVSSTTYDAIASSDGERFYLLVPSDVTRPTSFSMGGAPVDMVIPSSTTTIDGIAYYVFYTNATYNSGGGVQIKAQ